jgi:hypothetical protein
MKGCEVCFTPITAGPGNFARDVFRKIQTSRENVPPNCITLLYAKISRYGVGNPYWYTRWFQKGFDKRNFGHEVLRSVPSECPFGVHESSRAKRRLLIRIHGKWHFDAYKAIQASPVIYKSGTIIFPGVIYIRHIHTARQTISLSFSLFRKRERSMWFCICYSRDFFEYDELDGMEIRFPPNFAKLRNRPWRSCPDLQ